MITVIVALVTLALWYLFYLNFPGTLLTAGETMVLAAFSFGLVFAIRGIYGRLKKGKKR